MLLELFITTLVVIAVGAAGGLVVFLKNTNGDHFASGFVISVTAVVAVVCVAIGVGVVLDERSDTNRLECLSLIPELNLGELTEDEVNRLC